jgi:hypothetical protein
MQDGNHGGNYTGGAGAILFALVAWIKRRWVPAFAGTTIIYASASLHRLCDSKRRVSASSADSPRAIPTH